MQRVHHIYQYSFLQLFLLVTALILTHPSPGYAQPINISDIRLGVYPDKTRIVLDLSQQVEFRVFSLSDPERLVIDLPSFSWKATPPNKGNGAGITGFRQGNLSPGISRLVFDMAQPIRVQSAFSLPAQSERPPRLVIDYKPAAQSAAIKQSIFGTLNQNSVKQIPPPPPKNTPPVPAPRPKTIIKPVIVIDAGHGGVDPGAIATTGVKEKVITLALAKELKSQLERTGRYKVYLTRNKDTFIKLKDRVKIARGYNADLFVSIHADSIEKKNVRGASIYTLSETASDKQTELLAAKENRADLIAGVDLNTEDVEVANILVDLAMRESTNQGKFLANTVVRNMQTKNIRTLKTPHRHAGFAVLKAPDVPSILIEAGFLSNRDEAKALSTSSYRRQIAEAIKGGIDAYFDQVEKNQRS